MYYCPKCLCFIYTHLVMTSEIFSFGDSSIFVNCRVFRYMGKHFILNKFFRNCLCLLHYWTWRDVWQSNYAKCTIYINSCLIWCSKICTKVESSLLIFISCIVFFLNLLKHHVIINNNLCKYSFVVNIKLLLCWTICFLILPTQFFFMVLWIH